MAFPSLPPTLVRILAGIILLGHLVAAVAWWWAMPHGFPVGHSRFWLNTVLPLGMALLLAVPAARETVRPFALLALGSLWMAAGLGARMAFPITFAGLWLGPLLLGLGIATLGVLVAAPSTRPTLLTTLLAGGLGAAIGTWIPLLERGKLVTAQPIAPYVAEFVPRKFERFLPKTIEVGEVTDFHPASGEFRLQAGGRTLVVHPLLTFESRSGDGCWTLFARRAQRVGPAREFMGIRDLGAEFEAVYRDDELSTLRFEDDPGRSITLSATSRLPEPVWSHLNRYAMLHFAGRGTTTITFSPCSHHPIEVVASDYPVGRPARFAYIDGNNVFRVVEARSAEKGPFRELATGPLTDLAPLNFILHDSDGAAFRVMVMDWANQASRSLSPTAGWGVPANAIEFFRQNDDSVVIVFTLSGTSVGRGFDSVGHRPGIYRNRMRIDAL